VPPAAQAVADVGDVAGPLFLASDGRTGRRLGEPPPHHHQLARTVGRGPDHRREVVREDGGQGPQIARYVACEAREVADRLLAARDAIEVAYANTERPIPVGIPPQTN
jgi:hypothetical protein